MPAAATEGSLRNDFVSLAKPGGGDAKVAGVESDCDHDQ
jgi:hypothetical protein